MAAIDAIEHVFNVANSYLAELVYPNGWWFYGWYGQPTARTQSALSNSDIWSWNRQLRESGLTMVLPLTAREMLVVPPAVCEQFRAAWPNMFHNIVKVVYTSSVFAWAASFAEFRWPIANVLEKVTVCAGNFVAVMEKLDLKAMEIRRLIRVTKPYN
jgi:hypothetical protein